MQTQTSPPTTPAKSKRGLIAALVAAACVLCLLACGLGGWLAYRALLGDPPGQGAAAQRGYAASAPLIAALEAYHQAHGQYPPTLAALVPDHLAAVPDSVNGYPLLYQPASDSYTLAFSYTGPGMNHCTYSPATQWKCAGYY